MNLRSQVVEFACHPHTRARGVWARSKIVLAYLVVTPGPSFVLSRELTASQRSAASRCATSPLPLPGLSWHASRDLRCGRAPNSAALAFADQPGSAAYVCVLVAPEPFPPKRYCLCSAGLRRKGGGVRWDTLNCGKRAGSIHDKSRARWRLERAPRNAGVPHNIRGALDLARLLRCTPVTITEGQKLSCAPRPRSVQAASGLSRLFPVRTYWWEGGRPRCF